MSVCFLVQQGKKLLKKFLTIELEDEKKKGRAKG